MSEDQSVVVQQEEEQRPDLSILEYGHRDDIVAFGNRIFSMLPGASKIGQNNARALAQYALSIDANPWRGELYGWINQKGEFIMDEGYKLLVRWANNAGGYHIRYTKMAPGEEGIQEGDLGYMAQIMRRDKMQEFSDLIRGGMEQELALDFICDRAVGILSKSEMFYQDGNKRQPPTGWTWDERARTRALKNGIKKAFGTPSPREIAKQSWMVEDVQTEPQDWTTIKQEMSIQERELEAKYNAQKRLHGHIQVIDANQASMQLFDEPIDKDYVEQEPVE